jgi:hypothetical protein
MARKKKKKVKHHNTPKAVQSAPSADRFRPVKWGWWLLGAAITIGGGWATFRPKILVEPYLTLNPGDAFSERFRVSNQGLFAVYDVDSKCFVQESKTEVYRFQIDNITVPTGTAFRKTLEADQSFTIDCPMNSYVAVQGDRFGKTEIYLIVKLVPSWWFLSQTKLFRFIGERDTNGEFKWTYR